MGLCEVVMLEEWLHNNLVSPMRHIGIEVQEDAYTVVLLACNNQLRVRSVSSESKLLALLDKLTPDLVAAYMFKYGHADMTFGRAVRFLGDMAERWKDLRAGNLDYKLDAG